MVDWFKLYNVNMVNILGPTNKFFVSMSNLANVFLLFLDIFPVSRCKNLFLMTISDQSTYCDACYIWQSIIKTMKINYVTCITMNNIQFHRLLKINLKQNNDRQTQSIIIIVYFKESISDQSTKPFQFERGKKQTNYAPIKWSQDTACPWKFFFIADLK